MPPNSGEYVWRKLGAAPKLLDVIVSVTIIWKNCCPLWCQLCLACFRCTMPQSLKADVPKSNTTITGTPTFEWYVVTPGSQNGHQKRHVFKRDWTVCLKYAKHSRFNSKRGRRLDVHVCRVSEWMCNGKMLLSMPNGKCHVLAFLVCKRMLFLSVECRFFTPLVSL